MKTRVTRARYGNTYRYYPEYRRFFIWRNFKCEDGGPDQWFDSVDRAIRFCESLAAEKPVDKLVVVWPKDDVYAVEIQRADGSWARRENLYASPEVAELWVDGVMERTKAYRYRIVKESA